MWNEVTSLRFENADLCSRGVCRHSTLSEWQINAFVIPLSKEVFLPKCVFNLQTRQAVGVSSMPRHRQKPLYNCVVTLKALSVFQEIFSSKVYISMTTLFN